MVASRIVATRNQRRARNPRTNLNVVSWGIPGIPIAVVVGVVRDRWEEGVILPTLHAL